MKSEDYFHCFLLLLYEVRRFEARFSMLKDTKHVDYIIKTCVLYNLLKCKDYNQIYTQLIIF